MPDATRPLRSPPPAPAAGDVEAVLPAVRELLILPNGRPTGDPWLLDHTFRVVQLTRLLGDVPELAGERPDPTAAALAALYHDLGWALQVRAGQLSAEQVLTRPTSDVQRDLASNYLLEHGVVSLPRATVELAAEAIRQCNNRGSAMPEAQALADAENLDDIGLMHILRQFRQCQFEGRPLATLLAHWQRLAEYRYWEARIQDSLRFETSRRVARERLRDAELVMAALAREAAGA